MEKQLLLWLSLMLVGLIVASGVWVKLYNRRQKRLDAEAIGAPRAPRALTFEELWDERDAAFMRKWAHVTSRDYEREEKQAAYDLLMWRRGYRRQFEKLIDQAWDRIAKKGPRLVSKGSRFFKDFADMESDLSLAQGEGGYHGSMADTCWTQKDTDQLNALLKASARRHRKYKTEVRIR